MMVALKWEQVNAYRVQQHHLDHPADDLLTVVSHLNGAQAQVASAAELALAARVRDLTPADIHRALWEDHTLVKSWFLRGTLHWITAEDFPIYIGALRTLKHYYKPSWFKYHGVTAEQLAAVLDAIQHVLSATPITREQLADAVTTYTKQPALRELLLSGWGALLKPAAFQGYLCFGTSEGQNVTFVSPAHWLTKAKPMDSDQAVQEVARRFLRTYAPATIEEFARWIGFEPSAARKIFKALGDELVQVEVEGWKAYAPAAAIDHITAAKSPLTVRLLPHFDPYTIAVAPHHEYIMPEECKGRVYRPQGWISPVVLVNGRIAGVWEQDKQRKEQIIRVEMFASPSAQVQKQIVKEVARIGQFQGTEIRLVYEE